MVVSSFGTEDVGELFHFVWATLSLRAELGENAHRHAVGISWAHKRAVQRGGVPEKST